MEKSLDHDQADALLIDVGTESPYINDSLREATRVFGEWMELEYGECMTEEAKAINSTAWYRTIPVNVDSYNDVITEYIADTDPRFRLLMSVAEKLGVLKPFLLELLTQGVEVSKGNVSFIKVDDVKLTSGTEFREYLVKFLIFTSIHEAAHQSQDNSLPTYFSEDMANYYSAKFLGKEYGYDVLKFDFIESLISDFGEDVHKLNFGNLQSPQRETLLYEIKKRSKKSRHLRNENG